MPNDPPQHTIPVSEPPPRNIPGKLIMIITFIVGGIAVVLAAYYIAENYPIFEHAEPAAVEQEVVE